MSWLRPTCAEVDLDAVRANVAAIRAATAPAALMAVVKAQAYGHGAVEVARAALDAGATWLGVALVEEGVELRRAGIDARVLVLSEPVAAAAAAVVEHRLTPAVYTQPGIEALAKTVAAAGAAPLPVHLKVDTGMHRVGCRPDAARELAESVAHTRELVLEGLMTHLAVADEPGHPATDEQLARFEAVRAELREVGIAPPVVHAANSAGALDRNDARYDLVRCGIAVYGIAPAAPFEGRLALRPALRLTTRVVHVQDLPAGTRVSYGLRYALPRPARVATLPIGYADGVPRALGTSGGVALVRGRPCPIAGVVTMDQCMLDVGDLPVEVGDEVVLLGRQGDAVVTATEWADRTGTIPYEIVCGVGSRVPRRYVEHGSGRPA